jgi:hypothetical protein
LKIWVKKIIPLSFLPDNGAEVFTWPDGGMTPFRGTKGTVFEGGFRGSSHQLAVMLNPVLLKTVFFRLTGSPPCWRLPAIRILPTAAKGQISAGNYKTI